MVTEEMESVAISGGVNHASHFQSSDVRCTRLVRHSRLTFLVYVINVIRVIFIFIYTFIHIDIIWQLGGRVGVF